MQRDFFLGSDWLYYKIYTGPKTSDIILIEKLEPIILKLKKKNIIQKWFFIRYNDGDPHIRIRFLIKKPNDLSKTIQALYPILNKLLKENLIWKIQTDTYQRELERYGGSTITESESLFWKDSEMVLEYLSVKSSFPSSQTQLLFSFYAIDSFLNSFELSNLDKLNLMNGLQLSFKREFEIDKTLKKELDKHYRELSTVINQCFNYPENLIFLEIIKTKENQITEAVLSIKKNIQISLISFLESHIHMMINRQYTSKQRTYELIIYDHLYRYYKTLNYKQ
ncbi:thiopeptide-type bacteriocin biosynthesis protein [Flavobacterium sp. UBA7680]|uniref:thiopeptide-type bacteriocin biosynthesis protein n=1 Tax=Flavobacterium sp. UBA7680 TaxID=1946559 RepID=UPI0025BA3F2F|nr:thiopeptide-type bacteriocin biosynthesis protein [Flavobacterium sp. UBA7680]